MVWYSHLLKHFSQFVVIHAVKSFGIVNEAEIDIFLELSCFFNNLTDIENKYKDTKREGERKEMGDGDWYIHTIVNMYKRYN